MTRRLATLAALAITLAPRAQETWRLPIPGERMHASTAGIEVSMLRTPAGARFGGFGYVVLDVHNTHDAAHDVRFALEVDRPRDAFVSCETSTRLEPGQGTRLLLPLPSLCQTASLAGHVDGEAASYRSLPLSSDSHGVSLLCVADDERAESRWRPALERLLAGLTKKKTTSSRGGGTIVVLPPRTGKRGHVHVTLACTRNAAELPDRWQWLSGFDLIVVDGRTRDLTVERQELLVDYLAAGGRLLVERAAALAVGPLRAALADPSEHLPSGVAAGREHFGSWLTVAGAANLDAVDRDHPIGSWLCGPSGPLRAYERLYAGPVPDMWQIGWPIPGIGELPMRTFLLVVIGFVVLVGPLNRFFVVRRWRRPLMLLVTVPALGLTFTAIVLVYGLLAEGLDVKGTIRSVTVLDQRTHLATSMSTRSLYAGISPSRLVPGASTYLFSRDLLAADWREPPAHALELDAQGRIGGGLIPSRTVTCLHGVRRGPCRSRLRFRRDGEGSLELLADTELEPRAGADAIVVRDFEDRFWVADGQGRLRPVRPGYARRAAAAILGRLTQRPRAAPTTTPWSRYGGRLAGRLPMRSPRSLEQRARDRLALDVLDRPGTYVMQARRCGAVDDLGLEVRWLAAQHVVLGRLDREDFVD